MSCFFFHKLFSMICVYNDTSCNESVVFQVVRHRVPGASPSVSTRRRKPGRDAAGSVVQHQRGDAGRGCYGRPAVFYYIQIKSRRGRFVTQQEIPTRSSPRSTSSPRHKMYLTIKGVGRNHIHNKDDMDSCRGFWTPSWIYHC